MYLKRQATPRSWPIPRKGTAYVVRPKSDLTNGIPTLIVLRDMLKITRNRNEAKKSLRLKQIKINGKIVFDDRRPLKLFDILTIIPIQKNYRLSLDEKGKFKLEEVKDKEAERKIVKVINKKTLKNKKIQLNFSDGTNSISHIKCNVGDSVIVYFKDNKIEKCLELKERVDVLVIGGKHIGAHGKIEKLDNKQKMVELNTKEDKKINVLIKQIIIIE
ncbi:MAG: hypothetical protein AABX30_01305 [Nanoarchaeota archaeon]